MGKNTKIIATAIPTRMGPKPNCITFHVFLSPRLPDSGLLSDYYEIYHWPKFVDHLKTRLIGLNFFFLKYVVAEDGTVGYTNPIGRPLKDAIHVEVNQDPRIRYRFDDGSFFYSDNDGGYPLSKENPISEVLWKQMFRPETPVSGWLTNEVDFELADILGRKQLKNNISAAIDRTIEELLSSGDYNDTPDPYHPDHEAFRQTKSEISSFIFYLQQLKQKEPEVVLQDPLLKDNPVNNMHRRLIKNLSGTMNSLNEDYRRQLIDLSIRISAQDLEQQNSYEMGEFHKKFSAYSNYPFLLRNTGWIWEVTVDLDKIRDEELLRLLDRSADDTLKFLQLEFDDKFRDQFEVDEKTELDVLDPKDVPGHIREVLFDREIDVKCPYTCFELDRKEQVFTPGVSPEFGQEYFQVDHGFVRVRNDQNNAGADYGLTPSLVDKDQLMAKIGDIVRNNKNFSKDDGQPADDQANSQAMQEELNTMAGQSRSSSAGNEYVSNGIALSIKGLRHILASLKNANPDAQSDRLNDAIRNALMGVKEGLVYSHNLHVGYRVDVARVEGRKFLLMDSLCRRDEFYCVCASKRRVWAETPLGTAEGWLMESTQASQSGLTYVDEELFRWNDWSLVCPQIGDHEDVQHKNNDDSDPAPLVITEVPPDCSLVPLRFGGYYRFRLRVVDLCGNNSGYREEYVIPQEEIDNYWTTPIQYQRQDPVNTPILIPGMRIYSGYERVAGDPEKKNLVWNHKCWGESVEKLVIRAYYSNGKLTTEQISIRYIGPPKANLQFVIKHGVLDPFLGNEFKAEAIRNELFEYADRETMPSEIYYKRSQEEINYLFDPMVRGFEILYDRKQYQKEVTTLFPLQPTADPYWKNWQYLKLSLQRLDPVTIGSPGPRVMTDPGGIRSHEMVFALKQGVETDFLLGCLYFQQMEGWLHECVDKVKRSRLQLVHAVQKPCLIDHDYGQGSGSFSEHIPCQILSDAGARMPETKDFIFRMYFSLYPVYTAEATTLEIQYVDIVSDRTTTTGSKLEIVEKVVKSGLQPPAGATEKDIFFNGLAFTFPDTKFRRVNFRLEIPSRFKQYFKNENDFSIFAGAATWIEPKGFSSPDILSDGTRDKWTKVLNTNRPEPIVIERIVPILSWAVGGGSNTIVERYTDTIRIYFDGDWYSSGEGEQVALFFLAEDGVNSTCVPIEFESIISQFGVDPAAEPQELSDRLDILNLLKSQTMFLNAASYLDNIKTEGLEFDPSPDASGQLFCHPKDLPSAVSAAIFPVDFDPAEIPGQNGRFFIDVKINRLLSENLYFPFIRFAVARYQPNTVESQTAPDQTTKNYPFSKITITDYVQPLPHRKIEIKDGIPFKYHAKARRKNSDRAGTNKIYVFAEQNFDGGGEQLFDPMKDPKLLVISKDGNSQSKIVDRDATDIEIQQPQVRPYKYIVEEYEEYETKLTVDQKPGPRNDFSQRLVFSYVIDL
ncbi:hypothetical protein Q4E93_20535 [Flavitalea sp. BT771]|uniref:hypothetical protein n=1 Tax=Flavitalea sp. BT771 TaxID=3063329 RepID=UPI0026E19929|nr:hypothetical protein [Flavitalea sp. BT771]MDO6433007.1 hypothetical protein [Flavitalea sp. BT771]MDV6221717.1 hypothetical protein [Flavitalea sp. BT771]